MERQPEPLHQKQHKQQDDQHGPHKAQLLTDHGEDEVVVALGQPELFFNAVAKAEAGHAAGTDGVQALQGLVRHLGEVLRPAVEAALQVRDGINVLQQCLQQENAGSSPRPGDDAAVSAQQQDGHSRQRLAAAPGTPGQLFFKSQADSQQREERNVRADAVVPADEPHKDADDAAEAGNRRQQQRHDVEAGQQPEGGPPPRGGSRFLAVTACPNGIAHTYMAAEALAKAGDKLGLPTKVETNGSDGAKNVLTRAEIAACDGIIVAADKNVETARFDGKPVLFARVDDGIHKPEELLKKVAHGEVPVYHAKGGAAAAEEETSGDSFGRKVYKDLMNGVSHMLPFVVGGGIMIALAFLLDDYTIDPSNFGMNTPIAAFFKTVGSAAFGYMLPILAGFIAMSIADRPGLAVGFAGGVLAMNGTNFAGLANGETTGISGGFLAALLAGFVAGYVVEFLKKITEKLPASLNGIRPMLIYPLGGILIIGAVMCGINPVMGMINTAMTNCLNAMGGTSKVLLGAIVAGMMSIDMGGPFNKAAYVFGTAALASGNYEVMAAVMVGGMVPPIAIALSTTFCPKKWTPDERRNGIVNYVMGLCFVTEGAIPYAAADPLRVLPSCVAGAALAGALSMTFGCALRAPHGGIFVFPVVDHALLYCVALAAGSVVGAVILSLLKKNRTDAA